MRSHRPVIVVITALVLLLGLAEAVCISGYEPSAPFPSCTIRQEEVLRRVFAITLGQKVTSDFTGQCISTSAASQLWTEGTTIASQPRLQWALSGCFASGQLCYDVASTSYACGCLEDCTYLSRSLLDLGNFAFLNGLSIF